MSSDGFLCPPPPLFYITVKTSGEDRQTTDYKGLYRTQALRVHRNLQLDANNVLKVSFRLFPEANVRRFSFWGQQPILFRSLLGFCFLIPLGFFLL